MTYAWSARHRLCWPRMVWLERNYHEPEYETHRVRGGLRRRPRYLKAGTLCDREQWVNLPPRIGAHPVMPRWPRPKKRSGK